MRLLVRGQPRSGTTILTEILYNDPEICTAYEYQIYDFLYCGKFMKKIPPANSKYLERLHSRMVKTRNKYVPPHMDLETIYNKIAASDPDSMSRAEFTAVVEKELFQDKFRIIGDKVHQPIDDKHLTELDQDGLLDDLKVVWIYRDGRDVCSSNRRHWRRLAKKSVEAAKRNPWASDDMVFASDRWAQKMIALEETESVLDGRSIPNMRIKFEDLISNPDNVIGPLAEFLGLSESILANNIADKIKESKHHVGYYSEWIEDWEEQFTPLAKEVLARYGYI